MSATPIPHLSELAMRKHMEDVTLDMGELPEDENLCAELRSMWSKANFKGSCELIVAFKTLSDSPTEHPLNKLACYMTARPDDVAPAGKLSHTELMLQICPGVWYRFSINKKSCIHKPDGAKEWIKGRVHCKRIYPESMVEYEYFVLRVPREIQENLFDFLVTQWNCDFNFWGYALNLMLPGWMSIGIRTWSPHLCNRRSKYYCSELVCVALQLCGYCTDMIACKQSPNSLYRACRGYSVGASNPVTISSISLS